MRLRLLLPLVVVLALACAQASAAVHTSPAGVQLITSFEGYFPTVYFDPVGVRTQCYGATGAELLTLPPVATKAQCLGQLRRSLARTYEPPVRALFARGGMLGRRLFNQHRFDALASATYNLGTGLVTCGLQSMCAALRAHSPRAIAAALLLYDHAGGAVLPGLTRRRNAEAALFSKPVGRFELFPRREVALIRTYDRLRRHTSARARAVRVRLQLQMAARADRLHRVIHREHDGLTRRRAVRLAALQRRVHIPIATTGGTP